MNIYKYVSLLISPINNFYHSHLSYPFFIIIFTINWKKKNSRSIVHWSNTSCNYINNKYDFTRNILKPLVNEAYRLIIIPRNQLSQFQRYLFSVEGLTLAIGIQLEATNYTPRFRPAWRVHYSDYSIFILVFNVTIVVDNYSFII